MRRVSMVVGICVCGIMLMGAMSCRRGTESSREKGSPTGGRLFAVSFQTLNNPFFVDLNEGIREVVEANGDRLVTMDAQWNSLKQRNDLSDVLLQGATAIFINPVNWEGVRGSLIQARQKGVPVVIVDAPVRDADLVLCQVASDNVEAGRLAAHALAAVNPKARIVILHLSVNKACIDRVQGFREVVAEYPDMRILDVQEGKGTAEGSRPVMRDLLGRFPDLNAVFPINDPSALGAISAIESANRLADVTVVTVDGSQEGFAAIRAGKLHSTSAQSPRQIGRVAAEQVYAHLAGQPVAKEISVPVALVTTENLERRP